MANVLFKKGTLANLASQPKVEGTLYVTTDERALYLDTGSSTRIRLGDFQEYTNWAAIQALPAEKKISTVLYYAQAENILCKWTGTAWTQINPDTICQVTAVDNTITTATNGVNVETKVTDNKGNHADSYDIVGSGATSVTFTAGNGTTTADTITIASTDAHVTSAANHYAPASDNNSKLTADGNSTPNSDASTHVITGLLRDSKGHITGIESTPFSHVANAATLSGVSTKTGSGSTTNHVEVETQVSTSGSQESDVLIYEGAGGTTVSRTVGDATHPDKITITSTDQTVADAAHHYKATGVAAETKSASGATGTAGSTVQVVTGVTTDAAGHVTGITSGAATDTRNAMDTLTFANANGATVTTPAANDGFEVSAKTDYGTAATAIFDPIVTVGNGTTTDIHFVGGKATLPVYTKTQTDSAITTAIQAAEAMVIRGELTSLNSSLPTTNVQAGDTYIVTEPSGITITLNSQEGAIKAECGDLFVAKQDMASGSTNANWYYVPAGNDLAYFAESDNGTGIALKTKADNILSGELLFASAGSTTTGEGANAVTRNNPGMVASASSVTTNNVTTTTITLNMQWGEF